MVVTTFARRMTLLAPLLASASAKAATHYVAPTGTDAAAGTEAAPFASWARAQKAAAPEDTVYFRGGTYKYTARRPHQQTETRT